MIRRLQPKADCPIKDIEVVVALAGAVSDGHSVQVFCGCKQASLDGHACILVRWSVWQNSCNLTGWLCWVVRL